MTMSKRTGTQSIERAILILREIAKHGKFGWTPGELAQRCGLDRSTTQRILACLVRERMVNQRSRNRQYIPGPLIFELGLAMPAYLEFQTACEPAVRRVAKHFDATSALYHRSGIECVCANRAGPAVYGGTILEVGTRRPLLSSVGGVAILLTMPAQEASSIVEENKWQMRDRDKGYIAQLEKMLRRSYRLGYAFNREEVSRGVYSYGVPISFPGQTAFASLTVADRSVKLPFERWSEIIEILQQQATKIQYQAEQILPI